MYNKIIVGLFIAGLFSANRILAQVGISNVSITPDASSVLELRSTSLGFLPPRMTSTQRDAITSPANGLLVYNSTTNQLNYYNGSTWQPLLYGGAITSLNGLTSASQTFVNGTNVTITSTGSTHTLGWTGQLAVNLGGTGVGTFGGTNRLLYTTTTDNLSSIATANNGTLVTDASGVPSISSTLPSAVQTNITGLGTVTTGTWNATTIADNKIAAALTGKTYNGLTLTSLATGFSIAGGSSSKTLTLSNDATISGTNTGDQSTITGNAGSATLTAVTDDVSTNATMYPTWVTTASGNQSQNVSSSKLSFNPSTGILTSTGFAGNLTGNVTGNLTGNSSTVTTNANLSGDVTSVGNTTTIANNVVTYAKMQSISATSKLLGSSSSTTPVQEITIGSGLSLTGTTLSATSGGGSVTSVSVVTANGVSGSVATPTTTPAITLTLGAITPSSVAATGTVTGSNLSGTNTGNVTLSGENYLALASQVITANAINLSGTNVTGTLAAGRFPALTGDITNSAGSLTTTIASSAVTNTKMANMATKTYKGRTSSGTGAPEDVSVATLKSDLSLNNVANSLQVINSGNFNSINNGLFSAIPAAGTANRYYHATDNGLFYYDDGTNWNLITPALTGDITTSVGDLSTNISTNAVTFAKLQQITTNTLLGRSTSGTGNVEPISIGSGLSLSGGTLSSTTAGTVTSFSSGNLSPLFTTSVATSTSTPALSFTLSNAGANTYFGNATGSSAAPSFTAAGALTKTDDTNVTLTLGGNPTKSLLAATSITVGWTGTLSVARGGTGSSTQNFIDLSTDQSIGGNKTYTGNVSGITPTASAHFTTKSYVDGNFVASTEKGANNGVATLDAGGKIPATQLPTGSLIYKGTWDASTNTPTISDATGSNGWDYRVSVAGTQNLGSGNITFAVGDEVIHNGTKYQVSPSSNTVSSVNGLQGTVVLSTTNISEGTNLYYTDARVLSSTLAGYSVGSNTALNSSNSVLTAFQNVQGQLNAREPSISSGTTAQYWRGDKTFQTLDKSTVGLSNADNTSDANKPVSTATQTALNLKADLASPTFTGTPAGPTASAGTSTTQFATTAFVTTADNLKANLASPTFTGTPAGPTAAFGTNTTQLATTAFVIANSTGVNRVTTTTDIANSTTSLADVTGLQFPVVAGTYHFKFTIPYTSAATTTGSRWAINGPTLTLLNYSAIYTLTATSNTANSVSAYNGGAVNASSITSGNLCQIEGIITVSASGNVVARFCSEVAASAITVKPGATVVYTKIN